MGGILWIILVLVFISPFSYSVFQAKQSEAFSIASFIENFTQGIIHPFSTLGKVFVQGAAGDFIPTLIGFTIIYGIAFTVGFAKSAPKHEYSDIEHGSSDWSQHGEQFIY